MVKLFGYDISRHKDAVEEPTRTLVAGTAKGIFPEKPRVDLREYKADTELSPDKKYMVFKPKYISDFYDKYFDYDLVRGPIDDLAETAFGLGCYTTVETKTPVRESNRAKDFIDRFNKEFNLDEWNVNIGKNLLIAGFLPVESRFVSSSDVTKNTLKLIHPTTVKEVWVDKFNQIFKLVQEDKGQRVDIEGSALAWFTYGQVGNDPFGVSYIRGLLSILDTLDRATENVDKILDRYIAPVGIWKTRRGIEAIQKAVLERQAGEDIFLGDLTEEEMAAKSLLELIKVDPRVPYWEYVEYIDRRIYAYSRANNLWYSKDATVASAEILDKIVQRHVNALQRCVKRGVESNWYAKLVDLNNLPEIPRLNFGIERSGVQDIQLERFLTALVQAGHIDRDQSADLLMQMGLKLKDPSSTPTPTQPTQKPDGTGNVVKGTEPA